MNTLKEKLKKIWSKITESKLNISIFCAGVIVFILVSVILGIYIHRDGQINNELIVTGEKNNDITTTSETEEITKKEKDTTTASGQEPYSTKIDENATTNIVSRATRLSAKVTVNNSWVNNGERFIQYNLEVTNISDRDIDGWAIVLDMSKSYILVDSWNYTFKAGNKKLIINPLNDNRKIPAGETVLGGFIVKGVSNVYVDYITIYVGSRIETIKNGNTYIPPVTTEKTSKDDSTTSLPPDNNTTSFDDSPTTGSNNEKDTTTIEPPESHTDKQEPDTDKQEPSSGDESNQQSESDKPKPTETTEQPEINTTTRTEINTPEDNTVIPAEQ